jgi:phosphoribosylanthranilate isomerase
MRVKICGITNLGDALAAAELGADAVGFVFYKESPRAVEAGTVREIIRRLPPFVTTVGVFADWEADAVEKAAADCMLDLVQLQGGEPPDVCARFGPRAIKAIRMKDRSSLDRMSAYSVRAFVLDAYREGQFGGTGKTFDWDLAVEAKRHGRVILAGGLTPENVGSAIGKVSPFAVDVSSGVEIRVGKKDFGKVRRFIENARAAFGRSDREMGGL